MALALSYRRNVLIALLLLLLLGATAASGDQWIGWAFVLGLVLVLLIIDFMFGALVAVEESQYSISCIHTPPPLRLSSSLLTKLSHLPRSGWKRLHIRTRYPCLCSQECSSTMSWQVMPPVCVA